MPADARIVAFTDEKHWTNWHKTIRREPIVARYEIHNPETKPSWNGMRKTAAAIQRFIAETMAAGQRLHAIGARWSHSGVTSPSGGRLLSTETANWRFRPGASRISTSYKGNPDELVLLQCGVQISELNQWLETGLGRSLRTSGLNDGQTIVGAISPSSHGSAIDHGALHGQVCGLQILTGDRNLWLESSDDPVAGPALLQDLGATHLPGDDLFEAALVSLGGLGIVHSVMLRTAPIFLVSAYQQKLPYDAALKRAMDRLDFSGLPLPHPGERPYYFRVVINPHDSRDLAYVNVMYERPFLPGTEIDYSIDGRYGPGHDVPRLVAHLLDKFPGLTGPIANIIVDSQLKLYSDERGTWGETFGYSDPREKGIASATAVPLHLTSRAIDLAREAYRDKGPAPVVFTCRFIRDTPGLLTWQCHDRNCVIEVDGINAQRARPVMEEVRRRFDAAGIPYGQHWGKLHGLTPERVDATFGNRLGRWRTAREAILRTPEQRRTFSNAFLESVGLGA